MNYNRRNGRCELFEQVSGSGKQDDFVDFYKNLCLVKEIESGISAASNVPKHLLQNTSRSSILTQKQETKANAFASKVNAYSL